jgi:4-hydroxy-2-oxoheptanedioate aldolase
MMGIMMPGLETAEEVKWLVDAVKYAPHGKRGLGFSRASGHMPSPDYITFSNEQTMVIIQFEDSKLLGVFPELCAVEGLDVCVVGPRDLSNNMGFPDGPHHPEVQAVIDEAIHIMKETGMIAGITAGTRADVEIQLARGATMILAAAQSLVLAGSKSFLPED